MEAIKQTEIVPGQSSTGTFPSLNQNGGTDLNQVLLPPGKDGKVPANMATTDMLAQLVSGVLNNGPADKSGLGLRWSGALGVPQLVYGDLQNQASSNLVGSTENGVYLTQRGNVVPEVSAAGSILIQTFTVQSAVDGQIIPYPQQFSDDDVYLSILPISQVNNGVWIMPYTGAVNANRANFTLTRFFTDGNNTRIPGVIKVIAIGRA